MCKKLIFIFIVTLGFTTQLYAQSIFYIKGSLGPASQKKNYFAGGDLDYDLAGLGASSLSLGLNIGPQMTGELEFTGRSMTIDSVNGMAYDGDLDASAIMFNGLFKVPFQNGFSFLIGGGLGVISAKLYDPIFDNYAEGSTFATQFIIGGEAEITDRLDFTFEFKRLSAVDLELTGDAVFQENISFHNNAVMLGLKYNF